ncbi:MAG: hypothetical protein K5656_08885 [Lachnospiraceae bacterium]|nr:hypothetical protein [Lachnospiraceae bacterium]
MKLCFMKQDAIDFVKHNIDRLYIHYYQDETNDWIEEEYGSDPFIDFMEIPDFELASLDAMSIGEADFDNCKILYNNLRNLSESQASDERLWAGLCNGTFYSYMRARYDYPNRELKKKETDASAVLSRFFFSDNNRRTGYFRNGLAKCWWVGRSTFDKDNDNHYERLDIIGANDLTTKVSDIFFSNTFSSNQTILSGICNALKYFKDRGISLDEKDHIRASMKYLNAVGGSILLDTLTVEEITKLIVDRIVYIMEGQFSDIEFENEEDEEYELEESLLDVSDDDTTDNQTRASGESVDLSSWTVNKGNDLLHPEEITYGCWVNVLDERKNVVLTYHLPLRSDASRKWYPIEEELMGLTIGQRFLLSGNCYKVVDFGRDTDETLAHQQDEKEIEIEESSSEKIDFYEWLKREGFNKRVIDLFRLYIETIVNDAGQSLLDMEDEESIQEFIDKRKSVSTTKERTLYKYYLLYRKDQS